MEKVGKIVSVEEGLRLTKHGNLRMPIFSIWFDDGFSGVRKAALPILEEYNSTAASSVCSRFWTRKELNWRCKLSFLHYIDGMRFLRSRLKKYGYKLSTSVKFFTMSNFTEDIVKEMDEVFQELVPVSVQKDSFRLFDSEKGLKELRKKGWVLANHTAAHYPVDQDSYIGKIGNQFSECETVFEEAFKEKSAFWAMPFDNTHHKNLHKMVSILKKENNGRHLVFVQQRSNYPENVNQGIIFRISAPVCRGKEFIRHISK
ncbi:polysaccharide deacetylase family protein, partial [Fibrobacterota bacterium]